MPFVTRSILLVDDDDHFRRLARATVRAAGFDQVHEAASAAEGREAAVRLRPDVVLIDVGLPDGNGVELARELTAVHDDLRIILISADAGAADPALARQAGAVDFLVKEDLDGARLSELLGGR